MYCTPSKLCWADKLSIKYDPFWTYLPRALLSGEYREYYNLAVDNGHLPKTATMYQWYEWASKRFIKLGYQQSSEGISYYTDLNDRPKVES